MATNSVLEGTWEIGRLIGSPIAAVVVLVLVLLYVVYVAIEGR